MSAQRGPGAAGVVLSVFPGIDLLGRAFEEHGCCVVRGPDLLWGGDVRAFHPPPGVFWGVIGGPPCQAFSALRHLIRHNGHEPRFGNLIPEYERVVFEAQPAWFLMENVPDAPVPNVEGYVTFWLWLTDAGVGGVQPRKRRFSFGTRDGRMLVPLLHEQAATNEGMTLLGRGGPYGREGKAKARSIVADARSVPVKLGPGGRPKGGGVLPHGETGNTGLSLSIADACEAMGLPRDFTEHMPFTMHGKRSVIGNGVPMAMGRAVADAVLRAQEARRP